MTPIQALKEVMTLQEVADYLQVSEKSVLRMAHTGKIPAAKVASQWRFVRSVIDDWLMAQMEIPSVRSAPIRTQPPKLPALIELIPPALMNLEIEPGPKESVLKQMVQPLRKAKLIRHTGPLLQSLVERENIVSTGIGHGLAIPHPRRPLPGLFKAPAIALGLCREGTDFAALDHQRTYLFFLLCAPSDDIQLRLLVRVTQVGRHAPTTERIRSATSPEAVTEILRSADTFFEG